MFPSTVPFWLPATLATRAVMSMAMKSSLVLPSDGLRTWPKSNVSTCPACDTAVKFVAMPMLPSPTLAPVKTSPSGSVSVTTTWFTVPSIRDSVSR